MKHKPIDIPPELAAKYDRPDQPERFDQVVKAMLKDGANGPTGPIERKPRGRPKKTT